MKPGWEDRPLYMAWCASEPARFACENWHYSGKMPNAPMRVGVWEFGQFVGAVLYGYGSGQACNGKRYGLASRGEIAELSRVALRGNRHNPTSKVLARSIKMVKATNPKLRMLISFADHKEQGHVGTIYQATNWIYAGLSEQTAAIMVNGERVHARTYGERYKGVPGDRRPGVKVQSKKHRYLFPLDDEMKQRLEKFRKPYPKPRVRSETSDTTGDQPVEGGAAPTRTLS